MAQASTWRVMVNFSAQNMTGGAFSSLMGSINQAHSSTQKLQNALNALKVAGGTALADFGKQGIDIFTKAAEAAGTLQQQLVLMKQTLGSMGDNRGMQLLAGQRNELTTGSNPVLLSETDVASIQRRLLGSGLTASQITKQYGNRSLGGMITYLAELEQSRGLGNPNETASNLAGFVRGYGVQSGKATTDALDQFQKAQSITAHFSSEYLRYGEQYGGLTARSLKISPGDFITMLAVQAQQNIGASTAGTNLNNMLLYGLNPASMTNVELSARQTSLASTGMLGKANPKVAHQMYLANEAAFHKAGYAVDAKSLSPKQREALASYLLESSSTSKYTDYVSKFGGVGGTSKYMQELYSSETARQHKFGLSDAWRNKQFVTDTEAQFGVRGSRIVLAFAPVDAQGHIQDAVKEQNKIRAQSPAERLISGLRDTLSGKEQFAQSRLTDIMINLGGVNKTTGAAIPGGPLDILLKVMTQLNKFLVAIEKFTQQHPDAAAHIGTAIGLIGVAAAIAGTAIAGAGAVGLASAMLGVGGRTVLGAAVGGAGNFLGGTVGKLFAHPSGSAIGNAFHWLVGSPFTSSNGRFAKNVGAFGGIGPNIYRGASAMAHNAVGMLPQGVKDFGDVLGKFLIPTIMNGAKVMLEFASKLLGVVGWVMLAVDAMRFFRDHPKDIAQWIANIIGLFQNNLMPAIKTGFINIGKWMFDYLKDFLSMLNPMNWHKGIDWLKTVAAQVQHDMTNEQRYLDNRKANHGKVAPKHDDTHKRTKTREVAEHHTHIHLDGKEIAHVVDKHQTASLKRSMRASTGGLGVPGISYSATGLA